MVQGRLEIPLEKSGARGFQNNGARGFQKNGARGFQKNGARVPPYTTDDVNAWYLKVKLDLLKCFDPKYARKRIQHKSADSTEPRNAKQ